MLIWYDRLGLGSLCAFQYCDKSQHKTQSPCPWKQDHWRYFVQTFREVLWNVAVWRWWVDFGCSSVRGGSCKEQDRLGSPPLAAVIKALTSEEWAREELNTKLLSSGALGEECCRAVKLVGKVLFHGKRTYLFLLSPREKNVAEVSFGYSSLACSSCKGTWAVRTTLLLLLVFVKRLWRQC